MWTVIFRVVDSHGVAMTPVNFANKDLAYAAAKHWRAKGTFFYADVDENN